MDIHTDRKALVHIEIVKKIETEKQRLKREIVIQIYTSKNKQRQN